MGHGNTTKYSNESALSPDGKLLFRGSEKKMDWYLDRNLAEVVEEGPPRIIKLLFNPGGPGGDDYSLEFKETKCVCCGTNQDLTKHHVVPICYRKHFPLEYKKYNLHDVLLLCRDCHDKYEKKAIYFKKYLAKKYNSPLEGIHSSISQVVGYCKAILKHGEKIPSDKFNMMLDAIKDEFGNCDLITIKKASEIGRNALITHGESLVSKLNLNDLENFIKSWRKHFIEKMSPKYLPEKWDIDNRIKFDIRK